MGPSELQTGMARAKATHSPSDVHMLRCFCMDIWDTFQHSCSHGNAGSWHHPLTLLGTHQAICPTMEPTCHTSPMIDEGAQMTWHQQPSQDHPHPNLGILPCHPYSTSNKQANPSRAHNPAYDRPSPLWFRSRALQLTRASVSTLNTPWAILGHLHAYRLI